MPLVDTTTMMLQINIYIFAKDSQICWQHVAVAESNLIVGMQQHQRFITELSRVLRPVASDRNVHLQLSSKLNDLILSM